MDKVLVCIPARYHSTRLPGKPLLKINNKTIIQHVYDNVSKLENVSIMVLTDDERIRLEVESFGGNCVIITEDCLNGTDRIIQYLKKIEISDGTIVINVQGDEPFIDHNNIQLALDNYIEKRRTNDSIVCSTLYYTTQDPANIKNKSRGKAVLDLKGNIIYCSRNIIPSGKKQDIVPNYNYNIHIGIFVFNANYLLNYYYNNNTPLQLTEDIEWMKIMEQGFKINAVEITSHEIGVDTIDDYNYLKSRYEV